MDTNPAPLSVGRGSVRRSVNVWRTGIKLGLYVAVGIARTEFEALGFQRHSWGVRSQEALRAMPTGVGIPKDLRRGWARKLEKGSSILGDILPDEWACFYDPAMGEGVDTSPIPPGVTGDDANMV